MQEVFQHVESIYNITSHRCQLQTTVIRKNCLRRLETKRFHVNGNCTLAYGYPDIVKHNHGVAKVRENTAGAIRLLNRSNNRRNSI
jgi:hypothetical protein